MSNYFSLTPQRENEMIERIARFIAKSDIRDILKLLLKTYGLSSFIGTVGFIMAYPYATGLLGDMGQDFTELMGLNPVGSSQRILARVEELEEEERQLREKEAVERVSAEGGGGRNFREKLSAFFRRVVRS